MYRKIPVYLATFISFFTPLYAASLDNNPQTKAIYTLDSGKKVDNSLDEEDTTDLEEMQEMLEDSMMMVEKS